MLLTLAQPGAFSILDKCFRRLCSECERVVSFNREQSLFKGQAKLFLKNKEAIGSKKGYVLPISKKIYSLSHKYGALKNSGECKKG